MDNNDVSQEHNDLLAIMELGDMFRLVLSTSKMLMDTPLEEIDPDVWPIVQMSQSLLIPILEVQLRHIPDTAKIATNSALQAHIDAVVSEE